MRILGLTAMLALVALAGCLGGDDEPTDDRHGDCPAPADEAMDTMEPEGNETGGNESVLALRSLQPGNETGNETGPEAQSGEPETMEAGHDECPEDGMAGIGAGAYLASDVASGEAPLDVLFDFGVTEITMDEFLTWTLDVNTDGVFESEGNGNNLVEGGNFTFTYTEAGVWNATFEATDGIDSWNATLAITVTAAEEDAEDDTTDDEPTGPVGPVEQTFTGEWTIDSLACAADPAGLSQIDELEGIMFARLTVEEFTWGQQFKADFSGGQLADHIAWLDAAGTELADMTDLDSGEYYQIIDKVPTGAVTAVFFSCGGGASVEYSTPA